MEEESRAAKGHIWYLLSPVRPLEGYNSDLGGKSDPCLDLIPPGLTQLPASPIWLHHSTLGVWLLISLFFQFCPQGAGL